MSSKNVTASGSDYVFKSGNATQANNALEPHILQLCRSLNSQKVLDLGCGTGNLLAALSRANPEMQITGCDPSESGIAFAREHLPGANLQVLGLYDDPAHLGEAGFDTVISTEVVEHLFSPRFLPRFASQVLKSGGHLIVSTPYHGYLKNLLLSLTDHWDFHHTVLWEGGHVKFWSKKTLGQMLTEEGFTVKQFVGVGRFPFLWKSMILVARKNG